MACQDALVRGELISGTVVNINTIIDYNTRLRVKGIIVSFA